MSKRSIVTGVVMILAMAAVAPLSAQGNAAATASGGGLNWVVASIFTAGFALALAAGLAALGQGKAVAAALEAIARNPSAVADIRGSMIIGLVFIESVVIYVLLIALILFFVNPFTN